MKRMYTSQMEEGEWQESCLFMEPLDFLTYHIVHGLISFTLRAERLIDPPENR